MNTLEHVTAEVAAGDSPMHRHFRALPNDVQRGTIRRLAISGLHDQEIAARTGLSLDSVQRVVAEDDCLKMLQSITMSGAVQSRFAHRGSVAN